MVDIIIPAYNSHETIIKTISSIAIQKNSNLLNIYIINDGSFKDYKEIIKLFDYLNIKEIKIKKNMGPGFARQYGIDNSNGDYIMFIDSDDLLFDDLAIYNLYHRINSEDLDIVLSYTVEEINDKNKINKFHTGNLHGKIYRRKFLIDNNIRFNLTYTSEDNSFNQLILLLDSKVGFIDQITYIYKKNSNSLTHRKDNNFIFKDYIDNILWSIDKSIEIKENKNKIANFLLNSYLYIYYENFFNKLSDLVKLENIYSKYENYLSDIEKNKIYNVKLIESIQNGIKIPIITFNEFRQNVKKS